MNNDYEIRGDVTAIFVWHKGQRYEALISTHRLERAKEFPNKWSARWDPPRKALYVAGHAPRNGRKPRTVLLHRWILHLSDPSKEVDHFDNVPLNNVDSNLRVVTRAQNLQNRTIQVNNKSGYRGVSYHKKLGKWQANIRVNGLQRYLGVYDTPELASEKVKEARRKYMPFSKEAAEVRS